MTEVSVLLFLRLENMGTYFGPTHRMRLHPQKDLASLRLLRLSLPEGKVQIPTINIDNVRYDLQTKHSGYPWGYRRKFVGTLDGRNNVGFLTNKNTVS